MKLWLVSIVAVAASLTQEALGSCGVTAGTIVSGLGGGVYACATQCGCETECFAGGASIVSDGLDALDFEAACDAASLSSFACDCSGSGLSDGEIAAIVIGSLIGLCLLIGCCWWFAYPDYWSYTEKPSAHVTRRHYSHVQHNNYFAGQQPQRNYIASASSE